MASSNPAVTVSDITTDVGSRLDNPGYSTSVYLPWVSYATTRVYQALIAVGQEAKETLFGDTTTFTLSTTTPNEYTLTELAHATAA